MNNGKNIIEHIESISTNLSAKQRILAAYIINNYKEAAFMNSVELSKASTVSNPSVIRFSALLGYSGYNDMRLDLKTLVQQEISSIDRMKLLSKGNIGKRGKNVDSFLEVFYHEQSNIDQCIKYLDIENLNRAVELLYRAEQVYIMGFQASYFLANYTTFVLSKIKDNVVQFNEWNRAVEGVIRNANKRSVAFIIAMPRYPNLTIQFVKEFKKRKIPIILITDSKLFPYYNFADIAITIPISYLSYVDPFAPIISLINSLMIAITKIDPEKSNKLLNIYETYITDNNIFFKK